jgi:DNA-binding PucR family transcriptional regulator
MLSALSSRLALNASISLPVSSSVADWSNPYSLDYPLAQGLQIEKLTSAMQHQETEPKNGFPGDFACKGFRVVAKRDQEWIVIRIVIASSFLVIVLQNKASNRFQNKSFMLFEDDVIYHLLGQVKHCQDI